MKIRLWGTEDECKRVAQLLIDAPGFEVVSVDGPAHDHGAPVLVRYYLQAGADGACRSGGRPPRGVPAGDGGPGRAHGAR